MLTRLLLLAALGSGCTMRDYLVDRPVYDDAKRQTNGKIAVPALRNRDGAAVYLFADDLPKTANTPVVRVNKTNALVGLVGGVAFVSGALLCIVGGAEYSKKETGDQLAGLSLLGIGGAWGLAGVIMFAVSKARDPAEVAPDRSDVVYLPPR